MSAIAVIPGDGIGNEVMPEAIKVLRTLNEVAGTDFEFEFFDFGAERYLRTGQAIPDNLSEIIRDMPKNFQAILFGAGGIDPRVPRNVHSQPVLVALRTQLDLYANLRPCKLLDVSLCPLKGKTEKDIDFVVFRENTEGLYSGVGGNFKKGTEDEVSIREEISTRKGVQRIIEYAFEYAKKHNLSRVTMSEKSLSDGLWLRVFREVSQNYPGIEAQHLHIDTLVYQMVMRPEQFKVIVTENMFGDIASEVAAALHGGVSLSASACTNPETGDCYFEPVHGTVPGKYGKNISNPLATILSAKMMLEHMGFTDEANLVERAVTASIKQGKTTPDLGGKCSTQEVGDFVCQTIKELTG